MVARMLHLRLCLSACLLLLTMALAEPVQYCRFGYDSDPETSKVDFCMAVTTQHNHTSSAHDMYLTMTVTRNSAKGWTAIGTGPAMAGSLMFIVYGDPLSNVSPTLSIRTIDAHHQPNLVTPEDMNGASIDVLRKEWGANPTSPQTYIATISLVCHSCTLFSGTPIATNDNSLAWIWAWNNKMENMAPYAEDLHLDMHERHAEDGGWGRFYLDMPRSAIDHSESGLSAPTIQSGVAQIGTSDEPTSGSNLLSWFRSNSIGHLHGFLMGLAFLFLAPIGIMGIRSGSVKSFKYHWVIQLIVSISILAAATIGLVPISHWKLDTVHQWVGVSITLTIGVQGILGWRHHMDFLRIRRRTWKSYSHIWLGRIFMLLGWLNFVGGMLLAGYDTVPILIISGVIGCEMIGLILFVWLAARRKRRDERLDKHDLGEEFQLVGRGRAPKWRSGRGSAPLRDDEYFALGEDDEDEFSDPDETGSAGNGKDRNSSNKTAPGEESKKDATDEPMLKK